MVPDNINAFGNVSTVLDGSLPIKTSKSKVWKICWPIDEILLAVLRLEMLIKI